MKKYFKASWRTFFELGKQDFHLSNYSSAIRYLNYALLKNPRSKINYCFINIYLAAAYFFSGENITSINYLMNGFIYDNQIETYPLWLLINNLLDKDDFKNLKNLNDLLKIGHKLFIKYKGEYMDEDEMIELYWMRACICKNLNQNRWALTYYSKAISLFDNEKYRIEKNICLVNLLCARSRAYLNKGNYQEALNDINYSIIILGDNKFYSPYFAAAMIYKKFRNYNLSISMFTKAIDYFSRGNPYKSIICKAYIYRGYLRIKTGNIEEALDDFALAYAEDKRCFKKHKNLTKKIPNGIKNIILINSQIKI